jgi:hypothetical protein
MEKEQVLKDFMALKAQEEVLISDFRAKRTALESLIQPITDHNFKCVQFWKKHFGESEFVLILHKGKLFRFDRPKRESAKIETYLPFSVECMEMEFLTT